MIRMTFLFPLRHLLLFFFCSLPLIVQAQHRPTNIKVLDEYKDGKGNLVRVVQFNEGLMRVTQTIIEPIKPTIGIVVPIRMDTVRKDSLSIHIFKSSYSFRRYRC